MKHILRHPERHGAWYSALRKINLAVVGFVILAAGIVIALYIGNSNVHANCHAIDQINLSNRTLWARVIQRQVKPQTPDQVAQVEQFKRDLRELFPPKDC